MTSYRSPSMLPGLSCPAVASLDGLSATAADHPAAWPYSDGEIVASDNGNGVLHFSQVAALGGLSAWQTGHCMSRGANLRELRHYGPDRLIMSLMASKSSGVSARPPLE